MRNWGRPEHQWLKSLEQIEKAQNKHAYIKDWLGEIWAVASWWSAAFRGGLSFVLLFHTAVHVTLRCCIRALFMFKSQDVFKIVL